MLLLLSSLVVKLPVHQGNEQISSFIQHLFWIQFGEFAMIGFMKEMPLI